MNSLKLLFPLPLRRLLGNSYKSFRDVYHVKQLRAGNASEGELFNAVVQSSQISTIQKQSEILGFINICQSLTPKYVCEIGTKTGGTLVLLMQMLQPNTKFISVDIVMPLFRKSALSWAKQPSQEVTFLVGDSHQPETVELVKQAAEGQPLDVLFIDGDHSYEGVKRDFELYSPLVRDGGVIAFHDIITDFRTARGIQTGSITDGVPRFWAEIRDQYTTKELIDNPQQDGYGIGVVFWNAHPTK